MTHKFAVVHFLAFEEVEVAPLNWIVFESEKTFCYWPNMKNRDRILSAVKREIPPMDSIWPRYEIRVMHKFQTFEEASHKAPHFEEFSDLSEAEITPGHSRAFSRSGRPLKKAKLDFDTNSMKLDKRHENSPLHSSNLEIPKFPDLDIVLDNHDAGQQEQDNSTTPPDSAANPVYTDQPAVTEIFFPRPTQLLTTEFAAQFKEFQNVCFRNLATIQANQSGIMRMMEAVLFNTKANTGQVSGAASFRPNFGFPFKSVETLLEFDCRLFSDQEFRSECLKYLGTIGGSDLTTTVFEPLKKIMTYEVAYQFNFKGVNGKSNFSVLHLNDLIFDLVRGNPKTAPESMINVRNKIQAWVLHAGDKLPKEKKRLNNHSNEA